MTPIRYIRTQVFKVRQAEFAAIAGVTQATVSRWERKGVAPSLDELSRIRDEAAERKILLRDKWFFEPPALPQEAAA